MWRGNAGSKRRSFSRAKERRPRGSSSVHTLPSSMKLWRGRPRGRKGREGCAAAQRLQSGGWCGLRRSLREMSRGSRPRAAKKDVMGAAELAVLARFAESGNQPNQRIGRIGPPATLTPLTPLRSQLRYFPAQPSFSPSASRNWCDSLQAMRRPPETGPLPSNFTIAMPQRMIAGAEPLGHSSLSGRSTPFASG